MPLVSLQKQRKLRSALNVQSDVTHNSLPTRASKALSQTNGAGVLKAQLPARTMVDTVSFEDGDVYARQSKQPHVNESFHNLDEAEEEFPTSASCRLASNQLGAFLETFRKPFNRLREKQFVVIFKDQM